jgi:hypothetical protein
MRDEAGMVVVPTAPAPRDGDKAMKRMFLAAFLAAVASVPAGAATLYVGHGIDGRDLGQPQDLPVDICLVDSPLGLPSPTELFSGVKFGQFAPVPLDLPAGRYDVEVQLESGGTCDGPVAIASSVFLGFGENATALAHLNEQGVPTLTKFTNDVRPLAPGQTRIYARHAAAFGDVNVYLRSGRSSAVIPGLENPDQEGATLKAGSWHVAIYPASSWRHPAFQATLPLSAGVSYFAYAVGSPANGTFTVLTQALN